jgi:hypothetical protein
MAVPIFIEFAELVATPTVEMGSEHQDKVK